jgi:hypothetical protein
LLRGREVPTVITNLVVDGRCLASMGGWDLPGGACPDGGALTHPVQDTDDVVTAYPVVRNKTVVAARKQTPLENNPFMTRGAAISGALSGPHKAWDPV